MFDLVVMSVLFDWKTKTTNKQKKDSGYYCEGSHSTSYKMVWWILDNQRVEVPDDRKQVSLVNDDK
jgi:hypothetical protein